MSKFYATFKTAMQKTQSTTPTEDQLAQINEYFALKPLKAEEVYVREILVSDSAFMRSGRRIREDALEICAATLAGKSFFAQGHPGGGMFTEGYSGPGVGRFFNSRYAEMTPGEYAQLTGELPGLPSGVSKVAVLYGSVYILARASTADLTANIDAGIYTHVSMGWDSQTAQMKDEKTTREWMECIPPAEAMECSLVWLGDVRGAKVAELERMLSEAKGSAAAPPDSTGSAPERPEGAKILHARFVK